MTGALIILAVTLAFGLLLFYNDRRSRKRGGDACDGNGATPQSGEDKGEEKQAPAGEGEHNGGVCCGMHAVCEKLYRSDGPDARDYFDDEELDRFAGREADSFTEEETQMFREVLETMREEEVADWLGALRRRGIALPDGLRDETTMFFSNS